MPRSALHFRCGKTPWHDGKLLILLKGIWNACPSPQVLQLATPGASREGLPQMNKMVPETLSVGPIGISPVRGSA